MYTVECKVQVYTAEYKVYTGLWFKVFNATFNNISIIWWRSVLQSGVVDCVFTTQSGVVDCMIYYIVRGCRLCNNLLFPSTLYILGFSTGFKNVSLFTKTSKLSYHFYIVKNYVRYNINNCFNITQISNICVNRYSMVIFIFQYYAEDGDRN